MEQKKNYTLPIIMMFALFAMISFVTGFANPLGVIVKNQFSVANWMSQLGNAANFIAYAFMGIPAGLMLNRIGYKKTALAAISGGFIGVGIQYLSGVAGSFAVYLVGAFVSGFSMCMLNTVVNPMLNTLGGGGKRGNQLIQFGGSLNSISATIVPILVGYLMGDVARATISDASPALFIAMGIFAVAFVVLSMVSIPEPYAIEEKAAAEGSGWMGTLNDWFTSEGFAAYTVANGKLKAGDEIAVQHTCNLGADIGGAFGDSNKTLKAIALSAGELNPAFSSGVHDYTMILPEGVTALTVTPTASNKQNRVRIYVGGTEYGRKDAIPVQVGTVITLKVGNDGDAAPETYTIALQAAGNLLSGGNVSLTSIHQDGSAGTKVALTFDKETAAFTGKLANYTHLKQYNDGGFTVTLSDLPAGATAQLKSSDGKVLADFENGVASTPANQFTGSGSAYFYIAVTAQGCTENYKLTLTKPGDYYWGKFIFSGTPDFDKENVFYGYPEGTLFQTDENGNPTGETGYAKGCWNYTVYVSPAVGHFGVSYFMNVMGNSGLKTLKSKILVDGEVHIAERKMLVPVMQAFAKKPVPLAKDKTVIEFVGTSSKDPKIEIHTTVTVIVVKTTPAELTGFISALPSTDNLTYSEHYKIVMSYQRAYDRFTDEEKKQLSAETVKKLQDSVARVEELKKRHEGGVQAWIDLVNTFAGKVTAENYAQYYDAVQKAQVEYLELSDAQRAEFSYIYSAENAAVMTAYKAAYRTVNEQSILDGSSIGKPTEYYDDFMMSANHYNLDLGHEDTYYPAVFREIWTNRPTSLYPSYSTERGLPYTLPGILKFEIKDDSIFEIKEVEDVYKDGGLSSFGNTPAMKYYLVPKKAGTTTFTVTFTDKAGNFYGQIPEIPVHVNSPEETAIQDLNKNLTNFTSRSNTSKYDNWTYNYDTQGAPFTFKVNGTNAKVSVYNYLQYNTDGTPVKTDYTPDESGRHPGKEDHAGEWKPADGTCGTVRQRPAKAYHSRDRPSRRSTPSRARSPAMCRRTSPAPARLCAPAIRRVSGSSGGLPISTRSSVFITLRPRRCSIRICLCRA